MIVRRFYFLLILAFLAGCLNFSDIGTRVFSDFNLEHVEWNKNTYPVVILGGGIGGLTAGIYMAQSNIKTLILEGDKPGGALAQSHSVRNWPGKIDESGAEIIEEIKNHAIKSGAKVVAQKAVSVNFNVWPYEIETQDIATGNTEIIKALTCIIAMGATPNYLNVEGEQKYWGKGVTNCAICDGSLYKDKIVGVVGGGDAAIEEASYLSSLAKKVYIFVRRDEFRAMGKVKDEVIARSNVEVIFNTKISKIEGNSKKLTHVILHDSNTGNEKEFKLDGLFLAIGSKPNSEILKGQIDLDSKGYVKLVDDQETSKKGIYSVGDISDPKYKQAISSAGEGCVAALQAQDFLTEIGYDPAKHEPLRDETLQVSPQDDREKPKKEKKEKTAKKIEKTVKKEVISKDVIEITSDDQFKKEVLQSDVPVVVDFFATWCMPCQMMTPVMKKAAKDFDGSVKFVKVNIQGKAGSLANKYGVQGVPTFVFMEKGEEIDRIVGGRQEDQFVKSIKTSFGIEK
ncbi:MAG: thioredoxin [bacterium]